MYLVLSTTKSGRTTFTDSAEYLNLGHPATNVDDAATAVTYTGSWGHTSGGTGPYVGTNPYSDVAGNTATLSFVSGTHTIRVRVTGTQRAAATHNWGIVDRFEIANQPLVNTNYRIVNRYSGKGARRDRLLPDRRPPAPGPTGDGYFTIVSHDSGLMADVYNWDAGDNARIVQYTSGGGANQQWQLVPA